MKPVEYQNILAVDHLEKGYNYISSKWITRVKIFKVQSKSRIIGQIISI